MEVKYEKTGINLSEIVIYINNLPWRRVKSSYFERRLPRLVKSDDFKKEFKSLEKKKILNVSIILLSKRGYLKKEWFSKMKRKLFDERLLEEVFDEFLTPYFNEEDEVERRIGSYASAGKGRRWIVLKMEKDVSLSKPAFYALLDKHLSFDTVIETIARIESTRGLLETKGRNKTIAFFLRRGYSYDHINRALF